MRRLLLILALSLPLMGHAQSSQSAHVTALRNQIASESAALEAKVAADPKHSEYYASILSRKRELISAKAKNDPMAINVAGTGVRIGSGILEFHVSMDPKYKDAYAHIDALLDQLKAADATDTTLRHHYVTNKRPK